MVGGAGRSVETVGHNYRKGWIMLVLSRKVGERILVGRDVVITVVRVANGTVRIGIDAPIETPVVREEVAAKVAAKTATDNAANPTG